MFDSLRSRMLVLFVGTVLLTTLTITAFVQWKTERQLISAQDQDTRNLLQTLLLNVANEYESYLFVKEALLRERKSELQNITALALRQVQGLYEKQLAAEFTQQEAQSQAIEIVRRMRYANDVGYLWIQDTEQPLPRLLLHSSQPELEGKSPNEDPLFYAALDGKRNLFSVFTELCQTAGQGFVEYRWPKPSPDGLTEQQPKLSHVRYFESWGWVIGTGLYLDDIERETKKRLEAIVDELRHTFSQVRLAETGSLFLFTGQRKILIDTGLEEEVLANLKNPITDTLILDELMQAARMPEFVLRSTWETPNRQSRRFSLPNRTYVVHFEPLDWYIGTSVHEDELRAPAIALRWEVTVISGFFMALAIGLGAWLARSLTRPLWMLAAAARQIEAEGTTGARIPISGTIETRDLGSCLGAMLRSVDQAVAEKLLLLEELRRSEEDLRTTLNSIGDGVIATDLEGRIVRMNPVAEALTGWRLDEIRGQPLNQGFHIINAESRVPTKNPVEKALASGKIVGLANHTALIAKDGTEYQIADSASPIRDEAGQVTGVVLVFRDVTEEYRIREALRETQELQRDVFRNTPAVIYIKDREGRYLFVNRMYENLFQVSNEALKGKTAGDIFPSAQAEAFHDNDLQIIQSGASLELEESLVQDDVESIYMSVKFPLKRSSGEVFAMCGVATDITARKRAETELRQNSERLRMALQASSMGTWHWDLSEERVVWSNETLAIFGVDAETFGGTYEAYLSYTPSEMRDEIDRYIKGFLAQPPVSGVIDYEHPIIAGDGRSKWIEVRGTLFADQQGRPTQMTGVCADITERKLQEEELQQLRNYLSNIIDSMPSVLIGVDRDGKVTQWNRAAQRVSGVSNRQALGQPLEDILPRLANQMEQVYRAIQTRQEQSDHRRPYQVSGDTRYEDLTIYPLIANGVEGAVIRIDDVTDRLRIEEMMIQTEKMLSVGGLAAGMAHEINNPLGGIMQTSEVMIRRLTGDLPANERAAEESGASLEAIRTYMEMRGIPRMLETIREACRRAAVIVDNMLGFARMGDDNVSVCNLPELLDQTVQLSGTDYDLKKRYDFKQIEIVREYAEDLPMVQCSAQKLQQVFLNLLKNAAQAMQEMTDATSTEQMGETRRKPRLVLRLLHEIDTGMIRIDIADNGRGMEEAIRKRVFEPFFTTKPTGLGTGLGLSVSYFIITENLGGALSVQSQPGAGSTFTIRLPLT